MGTEQSICSPLTQICSNDESTDDIMSSFFSNTANVDTKPKHFSNEKLLIHGYIHKLQLLCNSTKKQRNPSSIISLCYSFWKLTKPALIQHVIHPWKREISYMDILYTSKSPSVPTSRLKLPQLQDDSIKFWCFSSPGAIHIPNISTKIDTCSLSTKAYDGIIAGFKKKGLRAGLILFESNQLYNQEEHIEAELVLSEKKSDHIGNLPNGKFGRLIDCGEHGLIYENYGKLRQLKYETIDITAPKKEFHFEILSEENSIFKQKYSLSANYSQMTYLPSTKRIFAVHCDWFRDFRVFGYSERSDKLISFGVSSSTECALFSFKKKKWTELPRMQIKRDKSVCSAKYDTYYHYELCGNRYNENVVWSVGHIGHTLMFDLVKNKWYTLVNNGIEQKSKMTNGYSKDEGEYVAHSVWIYDENLLCFAENDGQTFYSLDIRDRKLKWNVVNEWKHPGFVKQEGSFGENTDLYIRY